MWCPETESNRHGAFAPRDFKSRASASFAIRAGSWPVEKVYQFCPSILATRSLSSSQNHHGTRTNIPSIRCQLSDPLGHLTLGSIIPTHGGLIHVTFRTHKRLP